MQRRNFIRWSSLLGFAGIFPAKDVLANADDIFDEEKSAKYADGVQPDLGWKK